MKRRNFLRGILGTGAAVVAAPVIAKVESKAITTDSYHLSHESVAHLESEMKVSGDPLSTGSFAKALSPGIEKWYGKHYYGAKAKGISEIFNK